MDKLNFKYILINVTNSPTTNNMEFLIRIITHRAGKLKRDDKDVIYNKFIINH